MADEYFVVKRQVCERCGGSGKVNDYDYWHSGGSVTRNTACFTCNGQRTVKVEVPFLEALKAFGLINADVVE